MLMILKTNQYSSEVLFITWSATMVLSVPEKWFNLLLKNIEIYKTNLR